YLRTSWIICDRCASSVCDSSSLSHPANSININMPLCFYDLRWCNAHGTSGLDAGLETGPGNRKCVKHIVGQGAQHPQGTFGRPWVFAVGQIDDLGRHLPETEQGPSPDAGLQVL